MVMINLRVYKNLRPLIVYSMRYNIDMRIFSNMYNWVAEKFQSGKVKSANSNLKVLFFCYFEYCRSSV